MQKYLARGETGGIATVQPKTKFKSAQKKDSKQLFKSLKWVRNKWVGGGGGGVACGFIKEEGYGFEAWTAGDIDPRERENKQINKITGRTRNWE